MIVSVLIVLVGMVIYSAFRQGFMVWTRAQYTSRQERAVILLDRMAREISNTFQFNPVGFKGEEDNFYFPSLILKYDWDYSNKEGKTKDETPELNISSLALPLITKVTYEYQKDDNTLVRKEEVYAYPDLDELKMKPDGLEKEISNRVILDEIDKISFSYVVSKTVELSYDDSFSVDVPKEQMGSVKYAMPYAIKIDLALKDMKSPLTRTIFLPINRALINEEGK
jgi:hypothetical protein